MDMFGSCDAFFQVAWQGTAHKSAVVHDTLNPDWLSDNELEFHFPLRQVLRGSCVSLCGEVASLVPGWRLRVSCVFLEGLGCWCR